MSPIPRIRPFLKPKPYNHAAMETAMYEGAKVMSVRSTITSQFEEVAREQKRKLSRLTDDLSLLDSGLDSLSFARALMHLENAPGYEPFEVERDVQVPVTLGGFAN